MKETDRYRLEREFEQEIERNPHKKKALLYIVLDDFDSINRIMGYSFGEKLRDAVALRISSLLSGDQELYKNSSDSFILFVRNYCYDNEVKELAVLICQSFKRAFDVEGLKINLSEKVGVALYPKHRKNAAELLNHVSTTIYKGRQEGRHRIWFSNCDEYSDDKKFFMLTQDFYEAMEKKELELFYQPQWDLHAKKTIGFEALLRWKHPKLGYISPHTFINIAEKTGLIIPIGEQVLIDACLFLKKIQLQGYGDITISVNVSALQLLAEGFYENVMRILDLIGLEPRLLELEITETVLIREFEHIVNELAQIRRQGIKIAIDDFGKGYSSLAYLKNIPADTLKIDKIFSDDILELSEGENRHILMESIIILGTNMGLSVLAEGVETKAQMEYLVKKGCHKLQGYYLSKPVPEHEALLLLRPQGVSGEGGRDSELSVEEGIQY